MALFVAVAAGQEPDGARLVITSPRLLHKVAPTYTAEARNAWVQGTVLLGLVVTPEGLPSKIKVISPLGFGLDEKAVAAVEKWRFEPGRKDGEAVPVFVNVEVNFRFLKELFDASQERRRTRFNVAANVLNTPGSEHREGAMNVLRELAKDNYPPALYALGDLTRKGAGVDKDPVRGDELIRKAAGKHYGPAVFAVGLANLNAAKDDAAKRSALETIDQAASLGHYPAQIFAGEAYETGAYAPADPGRAERAFRFCAAAGHADCRYRLGRLLAQRAGGKGSLFVEAAAWLNLAAGNGQEQAREILADMKLTPQQASDEAKLRAKLQQWP